MSALPSYADDRDPFLERILERSARAVSGGGLHPLEIIGEVERACLSAVVDERIPNQITIAFHPHDFASFRGALSDLRWEIDRMIERIERQYELRRWGERSVIFETTEGSAPGVVKVLARFMESAHRPHEVPRGVTQPVRQVHHAVLVVSDGRRLEIGQTPFLIGRATGNDAVLVSLSVSRRHAQIIDGPEGLEIEDLDSTNGIVVDGVRYARVQLRPGVQMQLGEVLIWLEDSV